jgi:hypothetical protein
VFPGCLKFKSFLVDGAGRRIDYREWPMFPDLILRDSEARLLSKWCAKVDPSEVGKVCQEIRVSDEP